jgi:pSer/pThr/pTyr-binding forkhead associated (FHA) protein
MPEGSVLRIELSLKDKVLKTYAFTQEVVEIGRIPTADIFIDNTGISRAHTRIEKSVGGPYVVRDLGSTNGTYVNGERITEKSLRNNDVLSVNKFRMRVTIDEAKPGESGRRQAAAQSLEGTTVLNTEQIERLQDEMEGYGQKPVLQRARQVVGERGVNAYHVILWAALIFAGLAAGILLF